MPTLFDVSFLLPMLERGVLVLTPNKRLAAKIQQAYGAVKRKQGERAWKPAAVVAVDQYLSELWEQAQDIGYPWACAAVVSSVQRRQLFQQVVKNNSDELMMGVTRLASFADNALKNLELWDLSLDQLAVDDSVNVELQGQQFRLWAETFLQQLSASQMITREQSYARLATAFNDKTEGFESQPEIALLGFDQLSPLVRRLLSAASEKLVEVDVPARMSSVLRTSANQREEEIQKAALWARSRLEQNPSTSIGIIVPELGSCREQVERVFGEVFEPQYWLPETDRYALPFNFSAGTPLGNCPVISDALAILDLCQKTWTLEQACAFLQSPFWGHEGEDLVQRASVERILRGLAHPNLRVAQLRYWSKVAAEKAGIEDSIHHRLEAVEGLRRQQRARLQPSQWVEHFLTVLNLMGWPGKRRPDSVEYQQIVHWYQALESFSSLDSVVQTLGEQEALQQLQQILAALPFQAKTANGPIQILGALEGAGLQFDHCWVMGLSRSSWPPAPAPNPLLPISFQRQHDMPRCDAARELQLAIGLTENFAGCAFEVIFSSPDSLDGNTEYVSPIIHHYELVDQIPDCSLQDAGLAEYRSSGLHQQSLQLIEDSQGPALDPGKAKGGSGILKAQAACPFNAFAQYRLGAKPREDTYPGLTPMDRGNLIHDVLAELWQQWQGQEALLALDDGQLTQQVDQQVDEVLTRLQQKKTDIIGPKFKELEHQRLTRDVMALVDVDKLRPPFKVSAIEEASECHIGPLVLSVRLDRCDMVPGVGSLIIDYKTGKGSRPQNWQGDRPEDPQLPLYAVTAELPPAGVAFGVCNVVKTEYRGVGCDALMVQGISASGSNRSLTLPDTWDGTLYQWREILVALANEYGRGDAVVSFSTTQAQMYSKDLLPLNRYLELDAIEQFQQKL